MIILLNLNKYIKKNKLRIKYLSYDIYIIEDNCS